MKTKVFKFILPAFALLLAVSFAFATEDSNATSMVAYYYHPVLGVQQTTTNCPDFGGQICKHGPYTLYSDPGLTSVIKRP